MRWYLAFALSLIFSFHHSARSQSVFGLHELVNKALHQNPDVLIQKAQTHIAGLKQRQATSALLPNLDAEGGYIYSTYRNGNPDFIGANSQKEMMAYLALHQSLFDAELWQQYRQSRLTMRKQKILFEQARQDVILQVVSTYFNTLKLQGEVQVLQENLHSFQLMFKQSKLLFESGSVPEIDVKKSHVEYLLQKNGLRQAQKAYQASLNYLKELVGLAIGDSLKLKIFSPHQVALDSLSYYQRQALKNNPKWQALELKYKQALLQRQTALLRNLPVVAADFYYGWDTTPPLSKNNHGWQAMLNISLPLWHWGAQSADYRIAGLQLQQIEQTRAKLKKQILQQVINAYHDVMVQKDQIEAMTESKSEAAQAVKMARIGYQEGSVTNLELINTQKLFTRSKVEYLAAWYNFYIAKATLLHSAGLLKEDLSWIE